MGCHVGIKPTHTRATIWRVNHFTNDTINGAHWRIRTPAPISRPPGFQDRSLQPDLGKWAYGDSREVRTLDPLIKSQVLYRLSYGVKLLVTATGLEPVTSGV